MNIFLVRRYGHDESGEGANGPDTFFLVRARDRDDAAQLVDKILKTYPHKTVETTCHCISELGIDVSQSQESTIIHGPWYSKEHLDLSGYKNWFREWQTEGRWENQDTGELMKTARPNKALQLTPSRTAPVSYDHSVFPFTPFPELARPFGVAELGVRPIKTYGAHF